MSWLLNSIMSWITSLIVDAFMDIFRQTKSFLLYTPDVTTLPEVNILTEHSEQVLDGVFVLAFLAAATLTIVAGASENARYTAKRLMPRLIVAYVLARFAPLWCSQLIVLTNSLSAALFSSDPGRTGAFTAISNQLQEGAASGVSALLFCVCAAIITFLFVAVAFSYLTRLGVLVVLAIIAPLALGMHALEQTEGAAKMWWRALIGTLAIPLLQGMALQAGEAILLDPASVGYALGIAGGGLFNLLIVISLLMLAIKIPGMVRRGVMRATGRASAPGQVVRVMLVQRGLRLIGVRR